MNFRSVRHRTATFSIACATAISVMLAAGTVYADGSLDPLGQLIDNGQDVTDSLRGNAGHAVIREKRRPTRLSIHVNEGTAPEGAKVDYFLSNPLRIAVQLGFTRHANGSALERTTEQLVRTFGKDNVQFVSLPSTDLEDVIGRGLVDFVICDAGVFTSYQANDQLKAIASLWPLTATDAAEVSGALYIARADNEEITNPADMVGKRIAAYYPGSFSGYLVAERDMLRRGYQPEATMQHVVFNGDNPRKVVESVINGSADVGILSACGLERMIEYEHFDRSQIKLLGLREDASLQCAVSTDLYPGYYMAALKNTDSVLSRAVSASLFTINSMEGGVDWTLPASNRAVHDLSFDLKIGPYAHLARWSIQKFAREQSGTLIALMLFVVMVISYAGSLSILVRRRTRLLQEALADRDRIEKEAEISRKHIANLERTGIVGQMSTMIAHELKQPLGAITNFGNGLLRRGKRGPIDPKLLNEVLEEIVDQGTRASEIVNRVRAYAKHQSPELKMADMSVSIERAIETFKRSRRTNAPISRDVAPYLWADIDGWEIELAVLNLLKNAADALEETIGARIVVRVRAEDHFWRIEVIDNGAKTTQEAVDAFMQPLVTSKANGLGLGLSIVSNIAERHHGRLVGIANQDHGVTIAMDIPRSEMPEHTAM